MANVSARSYVIPAFANLASNAKSNPTAAAILQALTSIVEERSNGNPTCAHYFGLLMVSLEEGQEDSAEFVFLLKLLLPHLTRPLLVSKFEQTMGVLSKVLATSSSSNPLIRNLIDCLSILFAAQPPSAFADIQTRQAFNVILNLVVDDRPKIRRAAQDGVINVLRAHEGGSSLEAIVGKCLEKIVSGLTNEDSRKVLLIIPLLRGVLPSLLQSEKLRADMPKKGKHTSAAERLVFGLLQAQGLVLDAMFSQLVFSTLHSTMNAGIDCWSTGLLNRMVTALLDLAPPLKHPSACDAYLSLLSEATVSLTALDTESALMAMPRVVLNVIKYMDAPQLEMQQATAAALARVFVHGVSADDVRITNERIMARQSSLATTKTSATIPPLEHVMHSVASLFAVRYAHARQVVASLVRGMVQHFDGAAFPLCIPVVNAAVGVMDQERATGLFGRDDEVQEALWDMIVHNEDHSDSDDDSDADSDNDSDGDAPQKGAKKKLAPLKRNQAERDRKHFEKKRLKEAQSDIKYEFDLLIGAAITAFGAENFLRTVALGDVSAEGSEQVDASLALLDKRLWLLPLLKKYLKDIRTHISLFRDGIMAMALQCERASHTPGASQSVQIMHQTRVQQLWTLFPSFTTHANPEDVMATLPQLGPVLGNVLRDTRYPRMQESVCLGLTNLCTEYGAACALLAKTDEVDSDSDTAPSVPSIIVQQHDADVIVATQACIAKFAPNFLPILFASYEEADGQVGRDAEAFLNAIAAYIRLSAQSLVDTMGKQVLKKLINSTMNLDKEELAKGAATMMGLSAALAPKLSASQRSVLYRAIGPCLEDARHAAVQKRAYRVLAIMCESHSKAAAAEDFEWLETVAKAIVGGMSTSSVAGKRQRLVCMGHIVRGLDLTNEQHQQLFLESLGEIVLCLKDQNTRARQAAFDCLFIMSQQMEKQGMLTTFFDMVCAGLAGKTPHFRSATITALSRLYYKYSKTMDDEYTTTMVTTVCMLFTSKAREEVSSLISFCKSVVSKCPSRFLLGKLLPAMTNGMFLWKDDSKNKFKSKIRAVIEIATHRCGIEAVRLVVPDSDKAMIAHIEKESRKKSRRRPHIDDSMETDTARDQEKEAGMAASTLSWDADLQSTLAGGVNTAAVAPAAITMAKRKRRRDDVKYSNDGKIIVDEEVVQSSGTATIAVPTEEDVEGEGDGTLVYGQGGRDGDSGQKRRRVVRGRNEKTQKKPDVQSGTKGGASYQYIKMGKDFSSNWKDARSKSKAKGKGKKSMGVGQMGWKQAKKKRG